MITRMKFEKTAIGITESAMIAKAAKFDRWRR